LPIEISTQGFKRPTLIFLKAETHIWTMVRKIVITAEDVRKAGEASRPYQRLDLTLHFMTLAQVPQIKKCRTRVYRRTDLKDLIEKPLLSACEILYDKNIKTYFSNGRARQLHIDRGSLAYCYIGLEYDSLSDENKSIANVLATMRTTEGVHIGWELEPTSPASLLQRLSITAARKFKQQQKRGPTISY